MHPRTDGSDQHPHLRVYDGFHCNACGERNINLEALKRHNSKQNNRDATYPAAANGRPPDIDRFVEYVYLQTWCRGPKAEYWLVRYGCSTLRQAMSTTAKAHLQSIREREAARNTSHCIAQAEPPAALTLSSLAFGEQRPWIERTGWDVMFRGRDRNILLTMISVPWQHGTQPSLQLAGRGTLGMRRVPTISAPRAVVALSAKDPLETCSK